ncbi:hypothetical protein [Lysobacter capsici]|uniref:hypothetical protein n=1 Tax=Lysobacter capsici TaxID=435897 RepID=UPI00398D2DFB
MDALIRDYAVPSVQYMTRHSHSPDLDHRNGDVASGRLDPDVAATSSTEQASTTAAAHAAQGSTSLSVSPRAVARLLAAAPELPGARLSPSAKRLLAHARVAMHDPNWLRSQEFVDTLHRWIDSQAVNAIEPSAPERHEPAPRAIHAPGASASSPIRSVDANQTLVSVPPRPHEAASPDRETHRPFPDSPAQARINTTQADPPATCAQAERPTAANDPDPQATIELSASDRAANMDAAETQTLSAPVIDPATHIDVSPTPSPPESVGNEYTAHTIDTDFGGLLYLLNVALALELYGDFTSPLTPGIALSPWDWLAMIGRVWFGDSFRTDPLDALLAELAGRGADRRPGADFDPGRDTSVPDAWLRPWGETDRLGYRADASRLCVWHPQGFVVFDQPRDRELSPAAQAANLCATREHLRGATLHRIARSPSATGSRRPAQRWLDRLLPYLRARIARALGLDAHDADLPAQVCHHHARLRCDLTHIDVYLSLASLPLSLRIAGLDRDPGWIPAAGRNIRFHFDAAGFDTISTDRADRAGDRA